MQIHVPDGRLNSGEAEVTFRNNEISRAVIRGQPASFEQRLKDEQKLARGRASSIEYDVRAGTVRLSGDAWLTDGQNEIRGDTLIYDIGRQRIVGNPTGRDPGGVHITIKPGSGHDEHRRGAEGSGSMSLLRAESLGKSYRSRQVVKDLSLEVASGEVVGLLGPNGAGKTTAFYMIVGLVPSDEGRIWLDDRELTRLPMYRRAQLGVGYLPQEASVFRKLSVEDNILAILETRSELDGGEREAALEKLLEELHIGHIRESVGVAPVGRRAAPRRDRARARGRAALHSARRTLRRRRSDLRARHPAHHPASRFAQHRRVDHRP